jgi:predicted nuclease with TOPRIM domain
VKNKNQELINENTILKEKLNKLNMDINNIQDLKNKIKSLEKELNKKNEEIQQLLSQNNNNQGKYKITSINPGEEIMCINFVSMSNQDINNYGLVCKNTDLFIRAEERLYEDFPQFKKYETYFEANGKRIKRFQTLSENNIKDKNVINLFIIEE